MTISKERFEQRSTRPRAAMGSSDRSPADGANGAGIRPLSRRGFIKGSGAVLALSLVHFDYRALEAVADTSGSLTEFPEYADFRDVYRQKWTWDRVTRSTHNVNCAYQKSCVFNIYVKDGVVWREEQVGDYPQTNESVPDFNPRGCQKGACYSARAVAPSRVLHPLKRVGARGDGRWKRVSWGEALAEIADTTIENRSSIYISLPWSTISRRICARYFRPGQQGS